MILYTSYFAKNGRNEKAVSIATGSPGWFKNRKYAQLAPGWSLVRNRTLSPDEWKKAYHELVLSKLDPQKVVDDLGDGAIMLCWENEGKPCHRHYVAEWIKENTGIEVIELSTETGSTI